MKAPRIIESLLSVKKVTGVSIRVSDAGLLLDYCTLEIKKSEAGILKSGTGLNPEAFFRQADLSIPMALAFDGRGIIHKKTGLNDTDDAATVLHKTLPNTSVDDFYVLHTALFNGSCIASVCRKETINELLELFRQKKADVIGLSFGPFGMNTVLPLISQSYNAEISLPGYTLQFTDGYISDFSYSEARLADFKIGQNTISSSLIVAFAAAFAALATSSPGITNLPLAELNDHYRQKKLFKTGLVSAACFLFCMLLVNFFVFTQYNSGREELKAKINVNQSLISQIDTLKKELAEKELIVQKTGLLQASRTSYYADRIASTVPSSIRLTQLLVYPQEKNNAEESETSYKFKTGRLEIHGKCRYSIDVNDWINQVRFFEWVKDARLLRYNPSNAEKGSDFIVQVGL